ncbi:hypothetical protein BG32_00050 [Mesotoga sp. HF07.pep.5.2.highcov]|nr:hypothetical protein BG32_00050 [Mesotoga sp. HF07.pep.5.2.highcov]
MLRLIGGNMKRVLLITMILIGTFALSQIHLEDSVTFGSEGDDVANDLVVLSDGKLLLVGYTTSFSGELGSSKGEEDFLILKLDERLRIIWSKTYGGSGRDIAEAVLETSDGEIVVVGLTESSDGDVSESDKLGDFWVVKLSPTGELLWEKTFGGSSQDHAYDVVESPSGNILVAGYTRSPDGDIEGHVWGEDFWIVEILPSGQVLKQWVMDGGNNNEDLARKLFVNEMGDILITGYTAYKDVGISCNYVNEQAALAIIHAEGISSYYAFGGMYLEDGYDVLASGETIVIVGEQDAGISMFSTGLGGKDFYVVAIGEKGQELWSENYGGTFTDIARVVKPFGASDLLVAGHTTSQDIDIEDPLGMTDGWIIVVNENGELVESLSVGGSADDFILSGVNYGEKYILCGCSTSSDGDLESNKGKKDIWLITLGK